MILTHLILFNFLSGASNSDTPLVVASSSLSLINVESVSSGLSVGIEKLDAIYVGKGKR